MCTNTKRCRIVCDVALGASVCITYLVVVGNVQPTNRGFFCDDQSINYPFRADTVKTWLLLVTCLVIAPAIIVLVDCFHVNRRLQTGISVRADDVTSSRTGRRYPSSFLHSMRCRRTSSSAGSLIGLFLFGLAVTMLVTEIGKLTIGRLRPHFFYVCRPDFSKLNCSQGYIENYNCSSDSSPKLVQEARKSFPSGHSSMAVFVAIFLAYYFRRRLITERTVMLKLILDLLLCALATFTCLSRVHDNKHHWSDVLAGAVVGLAVAVWMVSFMHRSVKWDISHTDVADDYRSLSNQSINDTYSESQGTYAINDSQR